MVYFPLLRFPPFTMQGLFYHLSRLIIANYLYIAHLLDISRNSCKIKLMIRSEYMAMRPSVFEKYTRKYDAFQAEQIKAGPAEYYMKSNKEDLDAQYPSVYQKQGNTGIINLYGPMSEDGPDWIDIALHYNGVAYKNLIRAAEEARKDDEIYNIIVNANTPGGNIDGLDEAYKSLAFLAEKKHITAMNKTMIASAGVWYTSAAHEIVALSSASMIGSIGIVIDTYDFTGYYSGLGIERITITNTDSPNKYPDLATPEGQKIITKELDSLFGVFLERVTTGMTVKAQTVKDLKGEVIIAADAVKIGLMDRIDGNSGMTSNSSGSNGNQTSAEIQSKELSMEADVKAAFDKLTETMGAVGTRLNALEAGKPATAPAAETPDPEKTGLSAEDKTFCSNIITGGKYTASITAEAVKAISGDSPMATLKAMVAGADTAMELNAGKPAGTEGEETKPSGSLPGEGEKKYTGEINSEADLAAELANQGVTV